MLRDLTPLIVALCALVAAVYAARASRKNADVGQEANQIKWLQEAKSEAATAKREAEQAKTEAADTRRELGLTKRQAVEFGDLLEEYTRWILRAVGWAKDDSISDAELRRLINGGPPSLRTQSGRSEP